MSRPFKRSHEHGSVEEEEIVDDLAVAAGYAAATALCFASPPQDEGAPLNNNSNKDDAEIELEEEPGLDETGNGDGKEEDKGEKDMEMTSDQAEINDEIVHDGDESDVDLEEDLKRMTGKDTEEEEANGSGSKPATAHEIDPYSVNLERLKTEFELDVTLKEQERILNASPQQLSVAGKIQHHMVSERTIVIQSEQGTVILEEGTLLVISVKESTGKEKIIPLGRILEVFGPVSRPLYSIRIPEPLPDEGDKKEPRRPEDSSETKEPDTPSLENSDPWGTTGEYTLLLHSNPSSRTVFYLLHAVKILDASAIFKMSGRGSDASNVFDEEITNPNEVEYSDDEEERMAKRRTKRGGEQPPRGPPRHDGSGSHVGTPQGFHHNIAQHQGYPNQRIPYQGQPPPGMIPHNASYNASGPMMPHSSQRYYPGVHPAAAAAPPPPPPPEDECDTVYYDIS